MEYIYSTPAFKQGGGANTRPVALIHSNSDKTKCRGFLSTWVIWISFCN